MRTIIFGGGCFWCTEAVFQQVKGVASVESGYSGGTTVSPTYDDIGDHAEVIQITYDPDVIRLQDLLDIFFSVHDPTTRNRQGNDVGTQYRSIINCSEDELATVRSAREIAQKNWDQPIVTEIVTNMPFYRAESYHQNYFQNNPEAGYCQVIINPKLDKFRSRFTSYVK